MLVPREFAYRPNFSSADGHRNGLCILEISSAAECRSRRTRTLNDVVYALAFVRHNDVAAKSGRQSVLFVRSCLFDRCFTRPTIILGMLPPPNQCRSNPEHPQRKAIFNIILFFRISSRLEKILRFFIKIFAKAGHHDTPVHHRATAPTVPIL